MKIIPIIHVEDRPIKDIVRSDDAVPQMDGLPRSHGAYEFILDFRGYLNDEENGPVSEELFNQFLIDFRTRTDRAIILLDLGLKNNELTVPQREQLERFNLQFADGPSSPANDSSPEFQNNGFLETGKLVPGATPGLYLLKTLIENTGWEGVIVICSDQIGTVRWVLGPEVNVGLCLRKQIAPKNRLRVEYNISGSTSPGQGREIVKHAINWFFKTFDDVVWFLDVPRIPAHADAASLCWFDKDKDYHSSGSEGCKLHLKEVKARYPTWGETDGYAKTLLCTELASIKRHGRETDGRDKNEKRYYAICDCLLDFFAGLQLICLESRDEITFPTVPALPFLLASVQFFDALNAPGPLVLERINCAHNGEAVLLLGTRQCHDGYWELASAMWEAANKHASGELGRAFFRATRAEPKSAVEGLEQYPLHKVCAGVDGAAVPWCNREFIGLSWRAWVRKR